MQRKKNGKFEGLVIPYGLKHLPINTNRSIIDAYQGLECATDSFTMEAMR